MPSFISEIPLPPPREEWLFLQELRQPEKQYLQWDRANNEIPAGHLDLRQGITLQCDFSDPEALLETAFEDFKKLLCLAELPKNGPVVCRFTEAKTGGQESYRLQINEEGITLQAGDTEGMRRGIYFLEEQLTGASIVALPFTDLRREPWLRNRISR